MNTSRTRATSPKPKAEITAHAPTTPLNVLIVDDDPESLSGIEVAVRYLGHRCEVARDGLEAWAVYEQQGADIIISDWNMPRMDGSELCRKLRGTTSNAPYAHFVFVSGFNDRAHFLEGMRAGADDYMTKPVDLDELEARLEAARRVIVGHRQLEASNALLRRDSERLFQAARRDPLTMISNRLRLKEDLEGLASRASRYGHRYCAALCDIDKFKDYNDCFGHIAGDEALRQVTRTIRRGLRRGDSFYRYGGEEFLAILPEQSLAKAADGMDRIRREVERLRIPHAPSAEVPFVTISVGIADLNHASIGTTKNWLHRADAALYAAKARGRNRVEVEDGLC
jgi:diguanylate cyclase (GGDEF)-like protein